MLHRELIGGKEDHHPVAMNLNIAKGCRTCEIKRWAGQHLEPGSLAYSDGLACFSAVLGTVVTMTAWSPAVVPTA